jgi:hypothetical protein
VWIGVAWALQAIVYGIVPQAPGDSAWAAAAASPRLRLGLTEYFYAELGGHLLVPLTRHPFILTGQMSPVFQEARVTFSRSQAWWRTFGEGRAPEPALTGRHVIFAALLAGARPLRALPRPARATARCLRRLWSLTLTCDNHPPGVNLMRPNFSLHQGALPSRRPLLANALSSAVAGLVLLASGCAVDATPNESVGQTAQGILHVRRPLSGSSGLTGEQADQANLQDDLWRAVRSLTAPS